MIILSEYGSAVLLAEMKFVDKEYVPSFLKNKLVDSTINFNGKEMPCKRSVPNPNYPYKTREEERIARDKHQKKRREFILNYLKENYPNTGYAERFDKEDKWNKPLRFQNDETKACEFLNKDGRHCDKKRSETGCYTCCFDCVIPDCNSGECSFLKKE